MSFLRAFARPALFGARFRKAAQQTVHRRNMGGSHGRPGEFVDPLPHAVQPWHTFCAEATMTTMWFWILYRFYWDYNLVLGVYNPFIGETEEMTPEEVEACIVEKSSDSNARRFSDSVFSTKPRRRATSEMHSSE